METVYSMSRSCASDGSVDAVADHTLIVVVRIYITMVL
jgi:hypothetical protein